MDNEREEKEMMLMNEEKALTRGFLFACTSDTEEECFNRMLFATEKAYGPIVIRIRKGDLLFLNNMDTDVLHGIFRAVSEGFFTVEAGIFNRKYPYQVRIEYLGNKIKVSNAKKILNKFGVKRNKPLFKDKLTEFLNMFMSAPREIDFVKSPLDSISRNMICEQIEGIKNSTSKIDIEEEIPLIEATTFWDFPRQSYGLTPKGDNKYAGVTPALIIYNMVWRYTDPGELVIDPMCGSGTTIDVCKEEKRMAIGYDIHPTRKDIIKNDARNIPLEDNSVDMVFIDSPYGDNIKYNEELKNIGNISSESEEFYDELEKVMEESHRILKEGKVLGWLIGDQWVKKMFTPVGLRIYERLCRHFEPVDIICVNRPMALSASSKSSNPMWGRR
ncbi:MAG: methyltransferase domain-containing protein [Chloroflexi bacterium]|nr:methyltransferase domain-containing protein [Chloroflexota bacterium]